MHQTPHARVPTSTSPNKHSQTPKPCPKMASNQKSRGIRRTESPKRPQPPRFENRNHSHCQTQAPYSLALRNNQSPNPRQKDPGFPSPVTRSPKQPRKRNPKATPHPESPTMTPEHIKSPMQDQETETSQISTAQNNRMLPGIAPSEKQHPPIPI